MIKLKFKITDTFEGYPEDITYLQNELKSKGFEVERADILNAWESYSSSMCAGWMRVYKDGNLDNSVNILEYLEESK